MWKTIQINKQNIKKETDKSVLISMPHKSRYDGFGFWHSKKLVRDGRHSNAVELSYTEDFKFKLKRISNKTFAVLDAKEIGVPEFEEAFSIMSENIFASKKQTESYLYVSEPKKLDKEVVVLKELRND